MTLADHLDAFTKQSEALKTTIEAISRYVYVSRSPTIDIIQRTAAEMMGVPLVSMQSTRRTEELAKARWVAYWICRELTGNSYEQIARNFRPDLDHGTIAYGIRRIKELCSTEKGFESTINHIKDESVRRIAKTKQ